MIKLVVFPLQLLLLLIQGSLLLDSLLEVAILPLDVQISVSMLGVPYLRQDSWRLVDTFIPIFRLLGLSFDTLQLLQKVF